jgi:hypothetical protein
MIIQRSERALILAINLSLNVFPSLSLFLFDPPVKPLRFYAWGYKGVPCGGAMGEEYCAIQ